MIETLTGTGTLVRFALRRDRIRLPVWILAISLTTVVTAASLPGLYMSAEERQARAVLMSNPASVALGGPEIGVDDYTFGAMMTNEMLGLTAVAVALMCILTVVRHTRGDEAAGRIELVRANVVGRHAPLATALVVATIASVVLAITTAIGLGALGIESIDWPGSFLFAASLASVGIVFTAVTAVCAQITEHSRAAGAMAGAVLGAAYALRAAGDIGNAAFSWLSPIGWAQRTYAYVDDRWWPLLLALVSAAVLSAAAFFLSDRRDVGAGLRPAKRGPAFAANSLVGPFRLAWRLQRTSVFWWVLGLFVFGAVYGTLIGEVESFAADLAVVEDLFTNMSGEMTDSFLALLVALLAMIAAIQAILAALRARTDETGGLAEPVLATQVSRTTWLGSYVAIAAVGSAASLLAGVIGLGTVGALTMDDPGILWSALGASIVYLAPLAFTIAVAVALFGLAPAASAAVWIVIAYGMAVLIVGGLLGLPEWAIRLSPFQAVPMLPAEDFRAGPVLVITILAAGLGAAGFAGFRRRGITTVA